MFTGFVLKRYPRRVRVLEGIGAWGGDFAVLRGHTVALITEDREEAEIVAETIAEDGDAK